MRSLGLFDAEPPRQRETDYILVLGGARFSGLLRPRLVATRRADGTLARAPIVSAVLNPADSRQ